MELNESYTKWKKCIDNSTSVYIIPYVPYIAADTCVEEYKKYRECCKKTRSTLRVDSNGTSGLK